MTPDMDGLLLVSKVVDGDSVNGSIHFDVSRFDGWTLTAWKEDRFRIITLDTPERGEVGWAEAKAHVTEWLASHPNTRIRTYGRDSFGRTLADIYDRDTGDTLTEFMLRERGWLPWVGSAR
jgi:hypothetical protein